MPLRQSRDEEDVLSGHVKARSWLAQKALTEMDGGEVVRARHETCRSGQSFERVAPAWGRDSSGQRASMGFMYLVDHLANVQIVGASSGKHLGGLEGCQDLRRTQFPHLITSAPDAHLNVGHCVAVRRYRYGECLEQHSERESCRKHPSCRLYPLHIPSSLSILVEIIVGTGFLSMHEGSMKVVEKEDVDS